MKVHLKAVGPHGEFFKVYQMRITLTNHIRLMSFHLMGTCLMLACLWFFNFDYDIFLVFMCFWLIYTIPALYLHIEYTIRNAGEEIEIFNDELIVKKKGREFRYHASNLAKIVIYKSASLDRGGIQFTAIESYYYARLIAKSGEEIVITCLMGRNIDDEVRKLHGVPYERRKFLFCTLHLR